jgi:YHS domain-containing protein
MNTDGRLAKPGVICDVCGKDIEDVRNGNAQWITGREGKGCTIYFTHKECCHSFDIAHPGAGAEELSHFLVYLTNNLKMDWKEARKGAALLASIG